MTVADRIAMIRLMNELEEANRAGDNQVKKDADGTYHYYDSNGNEMVTAKMEKVG